MTLGPGSGARGIQNQLGSNLASTQSEGELKKSKLGKLCFYQHLRPKFGWKVGTPKETMTGELGGCLGGEVYAAPIPRLRTKALPGLLNITHFLSYEALGEVCLEKGADLKMAPLLSEAGGDGEHPQTQTQKKVIEEVYLPVQIPKDIHESAINFVAGTTEAPQSQESTRISERPLSQDSSSSSEEEQEEEESSSFDVDDHTNDNFDSDESESRASPDRLSGQAHSAPFVSPEQPVASIRVDGRKKPPPRSADDGNDDDSASFESDATVPLNENSAPVTTTARVSLSPPQASSANKDDTDSSDPMEKVRVEEANEDGSSPRDIVHRASSVAIKQEEDTETSPSQNKGEIIHQLRRELEQRESELQNANEKWTAGKRKYDEIKQELDQENKVNKKLKDDIKALQKQVNQDEVDLAKAKVRQANLELEILQLKQQQASQHS